MLKGPLIAHPRRACGVVAAVLAMLALMLATLAPAQAAPLALPALPLAEALKAMPDTRAIRAAGVWYDNYALAERVYSVSGIDSMTNPLIARFFDAIVALKPGPETGVTGLTMGRWRQVYGYDMFQINSEIYSQTPASTTHTIGVAVGRLDAAYIGDQLVTAGYTRTLLLRDRFYEHSALPGGTMNALALTPGRLIAGNWPQDVTMASLRLQRHTDTLGLDGGYHALAVALGAVEGAYLAANIPPSPFQPSPFPPPGRGHAGPRLHSFGLYAVAYQEPRPGQRYVEIGLAYSRHADALADARALRARLRAESLPVYGARWSSVATIAGISVHGKVLLARLRLRPATPPTFWFDVVDESDLSILSP